MLSKRCFCSVLVLILGTLSQRLMGLGPASIQIDRAEVERLRAGIRGRTIRVDWHDTWDYATIQEALNASVDGDTIIVLPSTGSPTGAYMGNTIFPARAITLRGINPDDPAIVAATVIDGNASGSVVTFRQRTPAEAALDGFTIRNGRTSGRRRRAVPAILSLKALDVCPRFEVSGPAAAGDVTVSHWPG